MRFLAARGWATGERTLLLAAALALVSACGDVTFRLNDQLADAGVDTRTGGDESGSDAARDAPSTGCKRDEDCGLATLHCDPPMQLCVPCVIDAHCTDAATRRCDAASHLCVECGVAGDCDSGKTCEPTTHHCLDVCGDGGNCAGSSQCDNARGLCVQCTRDGDCTGGSGSGGSICDTASGRCVDCGRDTDCKGDQPRCDVASGHCVRCLLSADCPSGTPVCDPGRHECVLP